MGSGFDVDDFDLEDTTGSFEVHDVTNLVAHQRLTEWGARGENLEFASFFDGTNKKSLDLVITLVADAHDDPGNDGGTIGSFDDLGIEEQSLELADPGLHLALFLLGGVVVTVFGEIAHFPSSLDLASDFDPTMGGELLVLGAQPVVGLLGELVDVSHDASVPAVQRTRLGPLEGLGLE